MTEKAPLPLEKNLEDALTDFPALVPSDALGLGRLVTVGRQTTVQAGYADLVLMDEYGQVCIVEVKKEGNPDTRRVVAQLLDYAAYLWGMSVEEFEGSVLTPFLQKHGQSPVSIAEHLAAAFPEKAPEGSSPGSDPVSARATLAAALEDGKFVLVVAAPEIPDGVQRSIQYLAARGIRIYGLEVDYFSGPVECFVPHVVVGPTEAVVAATKPAGAPPTRSEFLDALGDKAVTVSALLDDVVDAGATLKWNKYGPSIRAGRPSDKEVAYVATAYAGLVISDDGSEAAEPFREAKARLEALGVGGPTGKGAYWNVSLADLTGDAGVEIKRVLLHLVRAVTGGGVFVPMTSALAVEFTRNDNNIWVTTAPSMTPLIGSRLRGRLRASQDAREVKVRLEPIAGGQGGWVPIFSDESDRQALWAPKPPFEGSYVLTVEERQEP